MPVMDARTVHRMLYHATMGNTSPISRSICRLFDRPLIPVAHARDDTISTTGSSNYRHVSAHGEDVTACSLTIPLVSLFSTSFLPNSLFQDSKVNNVLDGPYRNTSRESRPIFQPQVIGFAFLCGMSMMNRPPIPSYMITSRDKTRQSF